MESLLQAEMQTRAAEATRRCLATVGGGPLSGVSSVVAVVTDGTNASPVVVDDDVGLNVGYQNK